MSGQTKFHLKINMTQAGNTYCHQGSLSVGEIVKTLALIWE
jgi:hypothetical protein